MTDDILRIVVGVDFTATGDHALDEAIRHAAQTDATELHPVYVIDRDPKRNMAELDEALTTTRDQLRARILERSRVLARECEQEVVYHVRVGEPTEAIHQVAVDVDADLIVIGTHARKGLSKMLLGSVAEELVRTAHVPVLVARPKELKSLPKTERPDEPNPNAAPQAERVMSTHERLRIGRRPSNIAGLL